MSTDPSHPAGASPAVTCPRRRRFYPGALLLVLVVAGLVVDGSRCTPADPTRPVIFRGETPLVPPESTRLTVATLNIHSGKGRDRRSDLGRTAAVVTSAPDIVGLNEVRGTPLESSAPDQAAQLGQLLGMRSAFVPTERRWWHDHFGNALLTRIPIRQIHRLPLPGQRGKAFRNAILVQFELHNRSVQLLSVHVDSQSDRELQLQAVISLFTGLEPPAILIGDLNSTQDDPQMQRLLSRPDIVDALAEVETDGRGRPHIDWILARGFRCRSGRLVDNDASDHPLATAELEIDP